MSGFDDFEVISSYTRKQAIEDGFLVDLEPFINEFGLQRPFKWPMAMSRAAWEDVVQWDEADNKQTYQDLSGRLWDVLFMAHNAATRSADGESEIKFPLYRIPRDGRSREPQKVVLKMHIGPGDTSEPVITIMLPDED